MVSLRLRPVWGKVIGSSRRDVLRTMRLIALVTLVAINLASMIQVGTLDRPPATIANACAALAFVTMLRAIEYARRRPVPVWVDAAECLAMLAVAVGLGDERPLLGPIFLMVLYRAATSPALRMLPLAAGYVAMLIAATVIEPRITVFPATLVMLAVVTVMVSCLRALVLRVQEQHRSQRALLDAVLRRLPFPVVVTDPVGAVMMANPAAGDLLGWSPGSGTRLADLRFVGLDGRPVDLAAVAGAEASALEVRLLRPGGSSSDILIETVPMGAEADGAGTVFALLDVSAQRSYEESLHHAAYHDALTGLPNRAMLWQHLNASVEPYSVLLVDLDDFKAINDTHGHRVGDELLAAVGHRLRAAAHGRAVVARLGADEFAVLCPGADRAATERSAAALLATFDRPFDLSGKRVFVRGTVGYGLSADAADPDEVMAAADAAMHRGKPLAHPRAA
ncbi:diguanylate cyclase domain-containing protein [Dactylosporangium sucinum]|uniref:Diguanylate cyclase n=1 Tax=Dactylosporangium sucinum TaxID=1424081 RepID=A0A917WME5_9ACTN|nr:diguanylate cyclase [Dactylosporangium sucinum]GGM15034.1 hypothetical protein GCM10007977_015200 [Dactylosporangium sucinum]